VSAFRHRNDHVRRVAVFAGALVLLSACSGQSGSPRRSSRPTPSQHATAPAPRSAPQPAKLRAAGAPWKLPAARSRELAFSTVGGLVVAGGLSAAHVSTATVWTLNPSGRVIGAGALAEPVHDATGVLLHGMPLVIAGGNTSTVDAVQRIGPQDSARVIGRLPQPRSDLVAATVGGSAYVLGGFDGTTSLSAVLRTTDGRHFTTVARLPKTVRYPAVAVAPGRSDHLLVFGGEHNGVAIDDVQQIDVTTGRSRVVGHLAKPLAHESAVVLDDTVWLVGGRSGGRLQRRIWRWDPARRRAVPAGRLPYAVADAGLATGASTAYLLGGETPEPTARVIRLSVTNVVLSARE
jgi:hypothetical protein